MLDRIKRDLNKFKAVSAVTNGVKLSKGEMKDFLKEQRLVEEKERIKNIKPKEKRQFFCSGTFTVETEYNYKTKKGVYQKKTYTDEFKNAKVIEAYTEKEAEDEFEDWGHNEYNQSEVDYLNRSKKVTGSAGISVKSANDFNKASETDMYLRAANPVEYIF